MFDPNDKKRDGEDIDPFLEVEIVEEEEADQDDTTKHQPDGDEPGDEQGDEADVDLEGSEDPEGEDEDGEERPKGGRAEKRIRQLVTRTKVIEQALAEERAARVAAEERAKARDVELDSTKRMSVEQVEQRIAAEEAQLKNAYKEAAEEGDNDKLWEINQSLAKLQVAKSRVEDWKSTNPTPKGDEDDDSKTKEKEKPQKPTWKNEVDQQQATTWVKKHSSWFGKPDTVQGRAATKMAFELDLELKAEGFDPAEAPTAGNKQNEFYLELDRRLGEAFPALIKKGSTVQEKQRMGSGGRSPQGRQSEDKGSKPKLTQKELDLCKRLNVTPKEYYAEKMRLAERSSGRR